jgi:uncharacterized membrane-anchored protein YitT (DUF2179 family)
VLVKRRSFQNKIMIILSTKISKLAKLISIDKAELEEIQLSKHHFGIELIEAKNGNHHLQNDVLVITSNSASVHKEVFPKTVRREIKM